MKDYIHTSIEPYVACFQVSQEAWTNWAYKHVMCMGVRWHKPDIATMFLCVSLLQYTRRGYKEQKKQAFCNESVFLFSFHQSEVKKNNEGIKQQQLIWIS